MAVNFNEKADGRIIEVIVTGKLQREDYDYFVPLMEQAIERHGKIRILFQMYDFHGWSACALWEDVKFDVRHYSDIERLAMIGDKAWEKGMSIFCKPFTGAEIRYFEPDHRDEANNWLEEGLPLGEQKPQDTLSARSSA